MNWDAISALAEVLGSLAVVISIAYLAVQIKQGSKSARSVATNESRAAVTDVLHGITADTEASRIYALGLKDPNALEPHERTRFDLIIYQTLRTAETLFWEHREGALSDEIWEGQWRMERFLLNTNGGRESWSRQKQFVSESFMHWVEKTLANMKVPEENDPISDKFSEREV